MILREAFLVSAAGIAIGLGAAFILARLVRSMLYGVSASDPFTFSAAALLAAAVVGLGASYIPARRAARVDPMVALRYE